MEKKKKEGIAPVLKQLLVYKSITFDLQVHKYTSISAAIDKTQKDTGFRFTKKTIGSSQEVTRIL